MSKLEKAIRKASVSREKAARRPGGGTIDDNSDTLNRLPVPYQLKAGRKHTPEAKTLERHRIITDGFSDEALSHYKMLRTRILQQMNSNGWSTLGITAPHDGAGKSITAINLAITMASQGDHEIFLVDLDMRNPSIAEYFGLPQKIAGLAGYLDGGIDLQDILWDVGVDNLVVLANRDRVRDSSERITSRNMQKLIQDLKSALPKSIVIFDLPPVLTADDPVAIAPYIDGFLMVVAEGETPRDDLAHAVDLMRSANSLGLVLNKSGGR
jgi:capsular exopolysaccharide synthesis family protein